VEDSSFYPFRWRIFPFSYWSITHTILIPYSYHTIQYFHLKYVLNILKKYFYKYFSHFWPKKKYCDCQFWPYLTTNDHIRPKVTRIWTNWTVFRHIERFYFFLYAFWDRLPGKFELWYGFGCIHIICYHARQTWPFDRLFTVRMHFVQTLSCDHIDLCWVL